MSMSISMVLWNVWMLLRTTANGMELTVLNGFGNSVDWWFILKLPQEVIEPEQGYTTSHCNCSGPHEYSDRGAGLCYLYADSNNPSLQHFSQLGYDCLGQGGFDPLSQTLIRHQARRKTSHWA